jgi:HEPN domain-containing protein
MPPEARETGTSREWLRRAKGNLALAKQRKPREAFWEDLCFQAQQAAEKAVKAVLRFHQIDFPKTHDLRQLFNLLDSKGHSTPQAIWEAVDLTDFAVETRYPGPAEPVTQKEYRDAIKLAEQVVKWAEKIVSRSHR